ncbi:MAG: hypothetical protein Q7V15_08610 [Phenylobacterium sp.]|uniref:hypothetical protein n=1 Tax=Phenylobacterium sp. TaxID=1871053 RepID=UPI0027204A13|nr:hypothetical protein [Phenylobacterium sp.]MDO8901400.1 hypothetical protein [Phenylobacterium sp.]MDP2215143.1 hypothetical protein [Phenylobacterium sp.]
MKLTIGLALATTLALGACAPAEAPAPPPEAVVESPPAPIAPGLTWAISATGEGNVLLLTDAAGAPVLRLGCLRNPAVMTLVVEGFTPISSEDRLTVGLDDELFVFVADLRTSRNTGVVAEAPVSADFLERLQTTSAVSAVYGAQQVGPYMPPPSDVAAGFAAECRRAVSVS